MRPEIMKQTARRAFGRYTWLLFLALAGLSFGARSNASSSAASIDACHLLTSGEIQQQLGVAMDQGRLQTTKSQASCDWTGLKPNDDAGVGVAVHDFDQSLWNSFTSLPKAKPVSGLGDAAFEHVPTTNTVMIKLGKYEIDVGVVDFKMKNEQQIAAAKALAALVVSRVH